MRQHLIIPDDLLGLGALLFLVAYFLIPYRLPGLGTTPHSLVLVALVAGAGLLFLFHRGQREVILARLRARRRVLVLALLLAASFALTSLVNRETVDLGCLRAYLLSVLAFLAVAVLLPAGRERWLFGGAFVYLVASILLSLGQCFISTKFYLPHWFGVTVAPLVGTGFASSSALTALSLAVAICLLTAWQGRWPGPLEGFLIVLAAFTVYLTFCRAVFIGLILTLLLLALITNRRLDFQRTYYRCLAFVLALVFFHVFMQQIKPSLDAYIWQDRLALQAQVMEKYRQRQSLSPQISGAPNRVSRQVKAKEKCLSNKPLTVKLTAKPQVKLTAEEKAIFNSPLNRISLRVEGKSGVNYSARTRLVLAVTLLNNIADRPFWGDGLGGFRQEYHRYLPKTLKVGQIDSRLERGESYSPHNTILGLWAEAGVFSFALFMALVALVLLRALRVGLASPGNGLALGLGFGVVVLLLASFFHNILGERLPWVALGVLAAHHV